MEVMVINCQSELLASSGEPTTNDLDPGNDEIF